MLCAVLLTWWGVASASATPAPAPPAPPVAPQQAPQVLVSVKYGPRGGVDGLLVAQYRSPPGAGDADAASNSSVVWTPALADQRRVCTDLCMAGLGGLPCGQACVDITPSQLLQLSRERSETNFYNKIVEARDNGHAGAHSLQFAETGHDTDKPPDTANADKHEESHKNETARNTAAEEIPPETDAHSSKENELDAPHDDSHSNHNLYTNAPRVEVCPTLCMNDLGWPLCDCSSATPSETAGAGAPPLWADVCTAFCPLRLRGCPGCRPPSAPSADADRQPHSAGYALFTANDGVRLSKISTGWVEWCVYQCARGNGGAACNCDRPPFF